MNTLALFAQAKSDETAGMAAAVVMVGLAILGLAFYFLPTMIAVLRRHGNLMPILIVNFFLGWSLIGWVVALAWAFSQQDSPRYRRRS